MVLKWAPFPQSRYLMKQLFKYEGKVHFPSYSMTRMQVEITDIRTGVKYKPMITESNKAFPRFYNNRINRNFIKKDCEQNKTLYFASHLTHASNCCGSLRGVDFYEIEELIQNFAEYLI